jgi:hypothetical protein
MLLVFPIRSQIRLKVSFLALWSSPMSKMERMATGHSKKSPSFLLVGLHLLARKMSLLLLQNCHAFNACLLSGVVATCGGPNQPTFRMVLLLTWARWIKSKSPRIILSPLWGGARWEDVYLKLDAMNLAVSGGRVNDVGVGGLTLGGRSHTLLELSSG